MADQEKRKSEETISEERKPKPAFYGSGDYALDPKGRTIVPVAYRKSLGDTFTISITRDGKGIGLYPTEVFNELFNDVFSLNQRRSAVVIYRNIMAKYSFPDCSVDGQGRILLPAKLRAALLKDAENVEISGAIDHVRIVSKQVAEEEEKSFFDNRESILDEIATMLDQLNQ